MCAHRTFFVPNEELTNKFARFKGNTDQKIRAFETYLFKVKKDRLSNREIFRFQKGSRLIRFSLINGNVVGPVVV